MLPVKDIICYSENKNKCIDNILNGLILMFKFYIHKCRMEGSLKKKKIS